MIEGELRSKDLSDYLDKLRAPRTVWISEDGSGIIAKASYDSTTNQIVGLVLPKHQETGIPISFSFTPNSLKEIEECMTLPMSTHVYLVLAQPLKENTPPFVLQIYGTNNKFHSDDVLQRWEYTKKELKK